jgi:pyruvate formate lyase activating enzyme
MNGGYPATDLSRCRACGNCTRICPEQARAVAGRTVTVDDVISDIEKDLIFYDESGGGVTFSGGDPLSQPEFLFRLLKRCRARDIHTAVDTSGYASRECFEQITGLTDLFLYDIKHLDSQKHKDFTGVDNDLILDNLNFLCRSGSAVIVRVPVIPGFNDSAEEIQEIAAYVKSLKTIREIDLLPYNSGGYSKAQRLGRTVRMMQNTRPGETKMAHLAGIAEEMNLNVKIGG